MHQEVECHDRVNKDCMWTLVDFTQTHFQIDASYFALPRKRGQAVVNQLAYNNYINCKLLVNTTQTDGLVHLGRLLNAILYGKCQ